MDNSAPKKCFFGRLADSLRRCLLCPFRDKMELLRQLESGRRRIAELDAEVSELKRENGDLESRLENYKKNSDKIDFIEEFGSVDKIIQKVGDYDRNEILIRDLEMENRKLEQENRKLKSLI